MNKILGPRNIYSQSLYLKVRKSDLETPESSKVPSNPVRNLNPKLKPRLTLTRTLIKATINPGPKNKHREIKRIHKSYLHNLQLSNKNSDVIFNNVN